MRMYMYTANEEARSGLTSLLGCWLVRLTPVGPHAPALDAAAAALEEGCRATASEMSRRAHLRAAVQVCVCVCVCLCLGLFVCLREACMSEVHELCAVHALHFELGSGVTSSNGLVRVILSRSLSYFILSALDWTMSTLY
jgi:hypothetical protein